MNLETKWLEDFVALAATRSFSQAAEKRFVTQPAFSRSIQGLEQEFGCVLVDRGNKDLRPTPEGQVVLQHALSLVQGAGGVSYSQRAGSPCVSVSRARQRLKRPTRLPSGWCP